MTLDTFLSHFHNVKRLGRRWTAQCPAHDDNSRNTLNIGLGEGGRRLVICRAGTCDTNAILGAAKLTARDLFDDDGGSGGRRRSGPGLTIRRARDPWSLQSVLLETLRRARERQREALALYPLADAARRGHQKVLMLRTRVTAMDPDAEATWDLAATASAIEREVWLREAEQDENARGLRR